MSLVKLQITIVTTFDGVLAHRVRERSPPFAEPVCICVNNAKTSQNHPESVLNTLKRQLIGKQEGKHVSENKQVTM